MLRHYKGKSRSLTACVCESGHKGSGYQFFEGRAFAGLERQAPPTEVGGFHLQRAESGASPQLVGVQSVIACASQGTRKAGGSKRRQDAEDFIGRGGCGGAAVQLEDGFGGGSDHGKMDVCV